MLALFIDENLNHRVFRGLRRTIPHLDWKLITVAAGFEGADDRTVLEMAAREGRVLATHDARTIPKYAYERLNANLPMPGVIIVPQNLPIGRAIEDLAVLTECLDPAEINSRIIYLPL